MKTPLHYAAEWGQLKACEFLIQKSANVYLKDKAGNMPIQYAFKNCNSEVSRLLLSQMGDLKVFEIICDLYSPPNFNMSQILFDHVGIKDVIDVFKFIHHAQAARYLTNPKS